MAAKLRERPRPGHHQSLDIRTAAQLSRSIPSIGHTIKFKDIYDPTGWLPLDKTTDALDGENKLKLGQVVVIQQGSNVGKVYRLVQADSSLATIETTTAEVWGYTATAWTVTNDQTNMISNGIAGVTEGLTVAASEYFWLMIGGMTTLNLTASGSIAVGNRIEVSADTTVAACAAATDPPTAIAVEVADVDPSTDDDAVFKVFLYSREAQV